MTTKKHFEETAHIFRSARFGLKAGVEAKQVLNLMQKDFADMFSKDNENFDYDRFNKACQIEAVQNPRPTRLEVKTLIALYIDNFRNRRSAKLNRLGSDKI